MSPPRAIHSRTLCRAGGLALVEDSWVPAAGQRSSSVRLESPSFSVLVPITDDGRIIFVRNRHSVPGLGLLELPGGRMEAEETPQDAARRELAEETGFRARRLTPIGHYYPNPHWGRHKGHFFLAEKLSPGPLDPDPEELLTPTRLTIKRSYQFLRSGKFEAGSTVIGLHMAEPLLHARGWLDPPANLAPSNTHRDPREHRA